MSKISNDGLQQIQIIKNALDSMYDKLNKMVYIPRKKTAKNIDELFYQTNRPKETPEIWRKVNEVNAMNVKTRQVHNFSGKTKVYQKI